MGTETVPDRSDGQIIDETWFDTLRQVITGTFVPRTGTPAVPTDISGALGSSTYRWDTSYLKSLIIGTASNLNEILENGTNLAFKIGGSEVAQIISTGFKRSTISPVNYAISSSSSGTFSVNEGSFTDITNLSVSLTTTGRPVLVQLFPTDSATNSSLTLIGNYQSQILAVKALRDSTTLGILSNEYADNTGTPPVTTTSYTTSGYKWFDFPSAGTYTYKAQAQYTKSGTGSSQSAEVRAAKLLVYEVA